MKKVIPLLGVIIAAIAVWYLWAQKNLNTTAPSSTQTAIGDVNSNNIPQTTIIAQNLDTPWGIVFLPDNSMLITERVGRVLFIDRQGNLNPSPAAQIENVKE